LYNCEVMLERLREQGYKSKGTMFRDYVRPFLTRRARYVHVCGSSSSSLLAFHTHALPPPTRLSDFCKRRHLTGDAPDVDAPGEAWVRWGTLFNLRSSPHRPHHQVVQTFPAWSVMHGHHEDITKVDCILTAPSQMIGGPGKDGELWLAHLRKPRRGQVCFAFSGRARCEIILDTTTFPD
jgi:hypothetical protein